MSRIGQQPITIPSGVDVKIDGGRVGVKGPKGELEYTLVGGVSVAKIDDGLLEVLDHHDLRPRQPRERAGRFGAAPSPSTDSPVPLLAVRTCSRLSGDIPGQSQ